MMKKSGKLVITSYNYEKFHKGEIRRVACFISENKLEYIKIIPDENNLSAGTILTGKVTNVVQNIPAAFIALDSSKTMGFLPLTNLEHVVVTNRKYNGKLQSGDEVLVKVVREPMKTKDYTLSSELDMTGRYAIVRMGQGRLLFSKKLTQKDKDTILTYLVSKAIVTREKQLIGMDNVDITIRTDAGKLVKEQKLAFLLKDIDTSVNALQQLISKASMRTCYTVHQRPQTWVSEMWSELKACGFTIEEYVTDDFEIWKTLQELVPASVSENVRFYQDTSIALATLYGLKDKIGALHQVKVWLPSGGYLCIEPTEALTVVDVNTGKAIRTGKDSEQLFFEINKEAAAEIARQLRLRNISGMIMVDFINMKAKENDAFMIEYMKACSFNDFSTVTVYDFTKLGLLELTRNKKSKALHEIL